MSDFILWHAKDKNKGKRRSPYFRKEFVLGEGNARWLMLEDFAYRGVTAAERSSEQGTPKGSRPYKPDNIISQGRAEQTSAVHISG